MSLIEGVGDGLRSVIVHDLYRDFAELEAKRDALDTTKKHLVLPTLCEEAIRQLLAKCGKTLGGV